MDTPALDAVHQLPFDEFLDDVDLVVMGRHCYDQAQHLVYVALGKKVIVATSARSRADPAEDGVNFIGSDVVEIVSAARDEGQHCSLFGRGLLD